MELIPKEECAEVNGKTYYLPHHIVINEASSTTKLQVVFDGSAKATTGVSLNDTMPTGPTIQDDLNSTAWLREEILPEFPKPEEPTENLEEKSIDVQTHHDSVNDEVLPILQRFSSLVKLKRTTALILRWKAAKLKSINVKKIPLTVFEIEAALKYWIKVEQSYHFSVEIKALKKNLPIPSSSPLTFLNPFMDNDGISRVGGRLQESLLPEVQRHQILIPQKSHLDKLIVGHLHQRTYHGGFQLTWNSIGSQFWVMGGRNLVRLHVRNCVACRRYRPQAAEQLMGNLPSPRVTPSRPFLHTGVDYAGPFQLKNPVFTPEKSPKYYKGYICLFVCLATKAIHLELVSSLTTKDFIAALRRFVSRRGICKHLYFDNGKNFVGAETELKKMFQAQNFQEDIINQTATNEIIFHFNPPYAPHRGGLWKSAVKSCKHHIRRVMGSRIPTYEEFLTLLNQIEAILNSGPLYKGSDDPDDIAPLTPGHFLIGQPLMAIPDEHLMDIPTNRLRSTLMENQQRLQFFWSRWSREYLNTLQANKWYVEKDNLAVNDVVFPVEDTPPGHWKLGRI